MKPSASKGTLQIRPSTALLQQQHHLDKLTNLKPLRENTNGGVLASNSKTPRSQGNKHNFKPQNAVFGAASINQQQTDRTPIKDKQNGDLAVTRSFLSQTKSMAQFSSLSKNAKTSRNDLRSGGLKPSNTENYATLDSKTSSSTYKRQKSQERFLASGVTPGRTHRLQHQLQQEALDENLCLYVVKGKKSQMQQAQTKPLILSGEGSTIIAQDQTANDKMNRQSVQSNGKFCNELSQLNQSKEQTQTINQSKHSDSKSLYQGVKSKVRQMLRSKTPKGHGALLSKQQKFDQNEKIQRRQQEITDMENEVQKIQNDLKFKKGNREVLLDTYKSGQQVLQDNVGKEQQTEKLQSKRQFTQLEYMIQSQQFTDKYFDNVYLDICGVGSANDGKAHLLEVKKQTDKKSFTHYKPPSAKCIIESDSDYTASVTFFEQRADKLNLINCQNNTIRKQQKTKNENDLNGGSDIKDRTQKIQDSPIKTDRGDEFNTSLSIGDETFIRKREEIRQQNQQLVQDFEEVYSQMMEHRKQASHMAFYDAMNEFNYDKKQLDEATFKDEFGESVTAKSPTKRLIVMKNTSIEHLKQIKDRNLVNGRKEDTLVYLASPQRAYVVQPDQKIDYNLAYKKNPTKFVEQALNQQITKHKIQQQRTSLSPQKAAAKQSEKKSLGSQQSQQSMINENTVQKSARRKNLRDHEIYTISSKTATSKPHKKIDQKIKQKIEMKLQDKLGAELTQQVLKALEEANFQEFIRQPQIQDLDEGTPQHYTRPPVPLQQQQKAMSVKSMPLNRDDDQDDPQLEYFEVNKKLNFKRVNQLEASSQKNPSMKQFRADSNVVAVDDKSPKGGSVSQANHLNNYITERSNNNVDEQVEIQRII